MNRRRPTATDGRTDGVEIRRRISCTVTRCHFGDRLNAGRRRTARLNTSVRVSRMAAPVRRRLGMDWLAGYRGSGRADDPLPVYAKPSPAAGGAAVSWVDGAAAAARASMTNRRRSRRRRVERSVTVARRRASSTLHTERSYNSCSYKRVAR